MSTWGLAGEQTDLDRKRRLLDHVRLSIAARLFLSDTGRDPDTVESLDPALIEHRIHGDDTLELRRQGSEGISSERMVRGKGSHRDPARAADRHRTVCPAARLRHPGDGARRHHHLRPGAPGDV